MDTRQNNLSGFHPLIAQWFTDKVGHPTDIQMEAWPKIARGEHVLIAAPTGSGKTLTAFLWAINQLAKGEWATGHTSVLYVSPLKALNNDIQQNLIHPLTELRQVFKHSGLSFPNIRALTRSGDTPQTDRRQMLRHPPEVLITTPESLNLLLSSQGGRSLLTGLTTVILDEIHAVIGNKRGTHLITAIDRLVRLSGEFQRISLSATIKPLATVAEFIGGYVLNGDVLTPEYTPRSVSVIQSALKKQYTFQIRCTQEDSDHPLDDPVWYPLVTALKKRIEKNRSTLVFTNSRKLCEKITHMVNMDEPHPIAYAHHGSLSREIRTVVEQKLKAGNLRAIVATNSLELGIDIGELDEVILVQSPFSISSAIQRIGRAGHTVGQKSRGILYPTYSHDYLYAAVLSEGILTQDIESVKPVQCPLDILAQILVSMTALETWDLDELFNVLRASYSYHHLSRTQYDLVLNMLAGRYEDSRIRELKPRISIDKIDNTVAAKKGALMAVYMAGGTIPNRGYFKLRHQENNAVIGELDEEFVWEANIGNRFTLGTQQWKIERITHNDVFVIPSRSTGLETPFWKNEGISRDFHFSSRISSLLESLDMRLEEPSLLSDLQQKYGMDNPSAVRLVDFLTEQKAHTRSALPHRHHLLMEEIRSGPSAVPGNQLVLHTLWGGRVNRPYAMAIDAAWEERFHQRLEIFPGNDSIVLHLPHEIEAEDLLSLVTPLSVESQLKRRLEGSGFFGARFRECAARSLLIVGNRMGQRMPLWMSRLRSQKLFNSVLRYEDFPLLLETWRTCLQDEFDLDNLRHVLNELASGIIKWSFKTTNRPSPFARAMSWNQINQFMYMDDQPPSQTRSNLRGNLLEEVVFSPELRPAVARNIIEQFEEKRQRLSPGYSPQSPRDLLDWVKDRLCIPLPEWEALKNAMAHDLHEDSESVVSRVADKLVIIIHPKANGPLISAKERVPLLLNTLFYGKDRVQIQQLNGKLISKDSDISREFIDQDREMQTDERRERFADLLGEWLQYYGPKSVHFIQSSLGLTEESVGSVLSDLLDLQTVIQGSLVADGTSGDICDSENFEILLRLSRAAATPPFEALELDQLPLYLAHYQGLTRPGANLNNLFDRIEQLLCLPLPAHMWESEIFPSRFRTYDTSWIDRMIQEDALRWIGSEKQKSAFCFEPDMDMLLEDEPVGTRHPTDPHPSNSTEDIFPNTSGRYDFGTLLRLSQSNSAALSKRLWQMVWQGKVTNDTFGALRRGIEHRFTVSGIPELKDTGRHRRQGRRRQKRFNIWQHSTPFSGNWFILPEPEMTGDLIDIEERKKERIRLLLDRYGILFRELLQKELPQFRWPNIFRSLRLMELSGEILAGYFFKDISGPQFMSHQAFKMLESDFTEDNVFWLNATDPASLCGLGIHALKGALPKRVATTHLVYRGSRLAMVSRRNGKSLSFQVPPEDPNLQDYFCSLHHLLHRAFQPLKHIAVETINGKDAAQSPYVEPLRQRFDVLVEFKSITLYRKII